MNQQHERFIFNWGSAIEIERRTRLKLCIAAYAYETGQPLTMTDAEFDALALQSNIDIKTGRFDKWWKDNFKPYTGSWVHSHPEFNGLVGLYERWMR